MDDLPSGGNGFPIPADEYYEVQSIKSHDRDGAGRLGGRMQYSGPDRKRTRVRWLTARPGAGGCAGWRGLVSVVDVDLAGICGLAQWMPSGIQACCRSGRRTPPKIFLLTITYLYARLIVDTSGDIWVVLQYCGGASCDAVSRLHRIHDGNGHRSWRRRSGDTAQAILLDGSERLAFWVGGLRLDGIPDDDAEIPALGAGLGPMKDVGGDREGLWCLNRKAQSDLIRI